MVEALLGVVQAPQGGVAASEGEWGARHHTPHGPDCCPGQPCVAIDLQCIARLGLPDPACTNSANAPGPAFHTCTVSVVAGQIKEKAISAKAALPHTDALASSYQHQKA